MQSAFTVDCGHGKSSCDYWPRNAFGAIATLIGDKLGRLY